MRIVFYLGILCLSVCFSGCENEGEPNPYDVVVDSTVNARLTEHRIKLSVRNDSILNALELARADSLSRLPKQFAKDTSAKKP